MCVYFPIGIVFGIPNDGQVASAFNTDPSEAIEFFKTIFGWSFLIPFVGPISIYLSYWLTKKLNLYWWRNPLFLIVLSFSIASTVGDFTGLHKGYRNVVSSFQSIKEIKKASTVKTVWNIIDSQPNKKTYVLIIGESVRRDYMHAYGYPIENTPFMESKGIRLEGAYSADDYTIPSLRKMLTLPEGKREGRSALEYNVLDAANLAGFETFWFSNQGKINKKDTPITILANRAHHTYWTKENSDRDEKISDSSLLPLLEKAVSEKTEKPKLIVLHLMGSHSAVCERLIEQPLIGNVKNDYYRDPLCYVSSIKQTDSFLANVDRILNKSDQSYSVIYLADHGVSHNIIQGRIVMNHASPASAHRIVPLYRFEDGPDQPKKIKATKFLSNLTEGVLSWLGIKVSNLTETRDLFSNENQPDERGELSLISNRRNDPSIDIRGK